MCVVLYSVYFAHGYYNKKFSARLDDTFQLRNSFEVPLGGERISITLKANMFKNMHAGKTFNRIIGKIKR